MRYTSYLFDDFDRAFNGLWNQSAGKDLTSPSPACETSESEQAYFLSFDVPGIKREDIKVEVDGRFLKISGERKREVHEQRRALSHQEKSYGYFERAFTLPESMVADKIEARFEDGVLEVAIPKKEEAKPRRIDVLPASGVATNTGSLFSRFIDTKKNQ